MYLRERADAGARRTRVLDDADEDPRIRPDHANLQALSAVLMHGQSRQPAAHQHDRPAEPDQESGADAATS